MMEDYNSKDIEVRILSYTTDNNIPEYIIEVLEQIAISAFFIRYFCIIKILFTLNNARLSF
jgi:hypothetical protein